MTARIAFVLAVISALALWPGLAPAESVNTANYVMPGYRDQLEERDRPRPNLLSSAAFVGDLSKPLSNFFQQFACRGALLALKPSVSWFSLLITAPRGSTSFSAN
jgi:hypothetical protein